jgi:hypothetical protein
MWSLNVTLNFYSEIKALISFSQNLTSTLKFDFNFPANVLTLAMCS